MGWLRLWWEGGFRPRGLRVGVRLSGLETKDWLREARLGAFRPVAERPIEASRPTSALAAQAQSASPRFPTARAAAGAPAQRHLLLRDPAARQVLMMGLIFAKLWNLFSKQGEEDGAAERRGSEAKGLAGRRRGPPEAGLSGNTDVLSRREVT